LEGLAAANSLKSLVYVAGSVIVPFVVQAALLDFKDQMESAGLASAPAIWLTVAREMQPAAVVDRPS